jgi:hypothetical protein
MRNTNTLLMVSILAGVTLCGIVATRMTSAQGPGGQRPGGQGRNFQGPGGRGGFGGQMPFAAGTITGGDSNTGRLTIQSQFGGNAQTIQVTNSTQLVTQTAVTVADLQVNDQVQVQGVPTGITASSLTSGQMPSFLPGGRPPQPGGGNPGGAAAGNANAGGPAANATTAFASATGKITATSPLTISIGNGVSLSIKLASNARVTKITPIAFNSLKVGDRVMAAGQAGADGTFAATGIAVNMEMGGMGPGGFGRGGGPGGPGGRGGPGGFGPGGPGGPGGPPPGGPPDPGAEPPPGPGGPFTATN